MIEMRPVLEVFEPEDFALWPVSRPESFGHLPLTGSLHSTEVGTAVMRIAEANDVDPEGDRARRPADPLGAFLHGLVTMEPLFAPGGMRVTDTASGTVLLPGCCCGIEEWREWFTVIDGHAPVGFGHDPDPLAELCGDTVRLTVDAGREGGPAIELPVTDLCRLLAGAERDLIAFHRLAAAWAAQHIPGHAVRVTAALARALDVPPQGPPQAR